MSVENDNIKNLHKEIQKNIVVMLPEKYKKVCLYASFLDKGSSSNGEMFFYYFPTGILKKNPINVYEIPKLFDVEEEEYIKLEKALYESIKKLRRYCVTVEKEIWSNITIIMEDTKYHVEYNYDDLTNSEFNNYSRHIVWRNKYLDIPMESYTKREREILERYFNSNEYKNSKTVLYEENIYEKQTNKVTIYDSVETHDDFIKKKAMAEPKTIVRNQLLNDVALSEKTTKRKKSNSAINNTENIDETPKSSTRNQLLNF